MPRFTLRGLVLDVPDAALRGTLPEALSSGRYEHTEADALLRHLRAGDRFLDLGAGLGYLCALAAREIGADRVTGVEAGPGTAGLARATLAANGLAGATILQGAVVAPDHAGESVAFGQRPAFWASALRGAGEDWPKNAEVLEVPALRLPDLLVRAVPTVLSCDIEGAEVAVLDQPLPGLRVIVMEIHPAVYGPAGTKRLFDALSAQGFAYAPDGSRGATVVMVRA